MVKTNIIHGFLGSCFFRFLQDDIVQGDYVNQTGG